MAQSHTRPFGGQQDQMYGNFIISSMIMSKSNTIIKRKQSVKFVG